MSETDKVYGKILCAFADEYNLEFTISVIDGNIVMGLRTIRQIEIQGGKYEPQ